MPVHLIRKAEEHLRSQELLQQVVDAGALEEVRDESLGAEEVGQVVGRVLGVLVHLLHQVMPRVRFLFLELAERDVGWSLHVAVGDVALAEVVEVRQRSLHVYRIPFLLVARDHLVTREARVLVHGRILAEDDTERRADRGGCAAVRTWSHVRRHRLVLVAMTGVENNFT